MRSRTDTLPADPFRAEDTLADLVLRGSAILDAIAHTREDRGAGLLTAVETLSDDEARLGLLVATLERWHTETGRRPLARRLLSPFQRIRRLTGSDG